MNRVEKVENLEMNEELTDLWLNSNQIDSWDSVKYLSQLKSLDTIYLHTNPVARIKLEGESD